MYGTPVLLSGLCTILLTTAEIALIDQHHKTHLQRLQKLHRSTPEPVVMFLAGFLPASALLHLKILGLLGMISRLGPSNVLNSYARHILLCNQKSRSWFQSARSICLQYLLPDPLLVLHLQLEAHGKVSASQG